MRRRIRLRRKIHVFKKHRKLKTFLIIFILTIISLGFLLDFINKRATPILMEYAETEIRKIVSIIINHAISRNVTENIDIDELFLIARNSEGEIKTVDFNPIIVNRVLTEITNSVQLNLKYLERGRIDLLDISDNALAQYDLNKLQQGIVYEIPSGVVFGNSFLANIGPRIPVRFGLIGDIVSYINTRVTNYGINNALVEVNIVLEVTERVILPFFTNRIKIVTSIPVALKLIQGTVPNYYFNGLSQNSPILSIPN